jgi:hypothetical protein
MLKITLKILALTALCIPVGAAAFVGLALMGY